MAYKIASERLGQIGATFDADAADAEGVNVPALLDGGHIVEEKKSKSDK